MQCESHGTDHGHYSGRETCCRDCGELWTGSSPCHCVRCHVTFGGETGFTRHQIEGECRSPEELGLRINEKGYAVREYEQEALAI